MRDWLNLSAERTLITRKTKSTKRKSVARRVGVLLLLVLVAGLAFGLWRVGDAPVSLPFVAAEVNNRLHKMFGPDTKIDVGNAAIQWQGGLSLTVFLDAVTVRGGKGDRIVKGYFPQLELDFAIALDQQHLIDVQDIRIVAPDITIPWPPPVPAPNSPWPLPVGGIDGPNRRISDAVASHGALLFDNLSISEATVSTHKGDPEKAEVWLSHVTGLAGTQNDGDTMGFVFTGQTSRDRVFDIAFDRIPVDDPDGGHTIAVTIKGFDFPSSPLVAGDKTGEFGWLPADFSLYGNFTETYDIRSAVFTADIGPGTAVLSARESSYLKTAQFQFEWRNEMEDLELTRGRVEFGDSVLNLSGMVKPTAKDPLEPWKFAFLARDSVINPTDVPGPPVILEDVVVAGALVPRERTLNVDRASIMSPVAPLEAVASFSFQPDGMRVAGAANTGRVHADVLKRLWPSWIVNDVRSWALNNIVDGVIHSASLDIALGPEETDPDPNTRGTGEVQMDFTFGGATIKSFGKMSEIQNASGRTRIENNRLKVFVEEAELLSPDGERVSASEGSFAIADIWATKRDGEVSFVVTGENAIVGAIANQEPVKALERLGVAPDALSGEVTAKVDAVFPLQDRIEVDDVDWAVDADFNKLTSKTPIEGRSIRDADVNITVDPTMFTMSGIATLDGVRADIQVSDAFNDAASSLSGDLTLVLSEKERIARGIDLGDALKGPVAVGVGVNADGTKDVAVDLTRATVNIPVFGWTKAVGVPGQATFLLREDGSRQILDKFKMIAGEAVVEGRVVLNARGEIASAKLTRFAIRKGDEAVLTARLTKRDNYSIDFRAGHFDGRGLIRTLMAEQGSIEESDFGDQNFTVTAKIDHLIGYTGTSLEDVQGDFRLVKNRVRNLDAKARIGRNGKVEATIRDKKATTELQVTTGDTGAFLRFLNLYGDVQRGDGYLRADIAADGNMSGHVVVTDLRVKTTQEFSNRFAQTSRNLANRDDGPAIVKPVQSRRDSRMDFEKFRAEFVQDGKRLNVTEAFIRSPLIGGTFAGTIDIASEALNLTGTMIPVYGLNNLFGQIPVLGQLIGAGRHGGLVGVTFRVTGGYDDPKLVINPASALAPGIFRRIFEFK